MSVAHLVQASRSTKRLSATDVSLVYVTNERQLTAIESPARSANIGLLTSPSSCRSRRRYFEYHCRRCNAHTFSQPRHRYFEYHCRRCNAHPFSQPRPVTLAPALCNEGAEGGPIQMIGRVRDDVLERQVAWASYRPSRHSVAIHDHRTASISAMVSRQLQSDLPLSGVAPHLVNYDREAWAPSWGTVDNRSNGMQLGNPRLT
jgi:hypothetical protein